MSNMTDKQAAEYLRDNLGRVRPSSRNFAESILRAAYSPNGASDRQWEFIHKLAAELVGVVTPVADEVCSVPRVYNLLTNALNAGIQKATIRLSLPDNMGRVIIRISAKSRRVFVNDRDREYTNPKTGDVRKVTYGEIAPSAVFEPSRYAKPEFVKAVRVALTAFEENPAKAASLEGHATGNCCFCGRHLDNAASVKAGYGPICAERYGLPHGDGSESNAANVWDRLTDAGLTSQ